MEAAQMATEALQLLLSALEARAAIDVDAALPAAEPPIVQAFRELQSLDGWAKVTYERLCDDSHDAWAMHDLHRSLEQAVGLHPQFAASLDAALRHGTPERPSLPTQTFTRSDLARSR